ncbi:ervatamin-B-like [Vicia villosa]|uniref:ervatamin-B-like n=1 Tax=Vicia villosa TaxID=3911 RepID=UPI00273C5B67|nr:ervatamin-B-like [Vicia villosa]XP_058781657.1 ervatamin-B-like [Vicia villosa]XP_058783476.1 ervatamin-B-like [Vicia villosa]XP_058787194.1 ervatamin-B-like [Vicia villosa]
MEEGFEDWRTSGHLNEVKNQETGDCCFAFTACAAVEVLHHKHPDSQIRVVLSCQDLWNNLVTVDQTEPGCSILDTLKWIYFNGCVLEEHCPYLGRLQPPIPLEDRRVKMRIKTLKPVLRKNMEYEVYRGPVIVEIDWLQEMDLIRGDGIYSGPLRASTFKNGKIEKHGVLVVGFGAQMEGDELIKFWIIQNSHGSGWGHNGYAKFNRAKIHNRYLINDGWTVVGISYCDLEGHPYEEL